MRKPIILVENISKVFTSKQRKKGEKRVKKVEALKNVSLEICDGEVFGLLGPNGAGKTTLIKCLTTLLLPTSGTAWINGFNLQKEENKVRASIGCMLMGERGLYWKLTGRENLDYFGALYHIPKNVRRKRIEYLIDLLDLSDFVDRTVETYSSGQKMTFAFAKSLINDAPILFLDEPTVTMDVHAARRLRSIVKNLNKEGHTVIYTTHLMAEADELCDRVAIIDRGEIIALGPPNELKSSIPQESVIDVEGVIPESARDKILAIPGIKSAVVKDETNGRTKLGIICDNSRRLLPAIIEALVEEEASIEYISPQDVTLEDFFIAKTGRSLSIDTREVVTEKGAETR
ncbi:MAG: ABC transporter ATP-binding protein [Thermoplasmata archaeon]